MLAVTMSRGARARAVQLPAWNEALGLPRAWDQQWSIRMQQVLAYESDLLEYDDLFDGSPVVAAKVAEIKDGARAEIDNILEMGGAVAAVESGYLKSSLVSSLALRRRRIESGEAVVVGVNKFTESEPNPLLGGEDGGILTVDAAVEESAKAAIRQWREGRDSSAVDDALTRLRDAAKTDENLMDASLACARVGVTVGEWAGVLREVFGEYRPPTGVAGASGGGHEGGISAVQQRVRELGEQLGRPPKFLVGKPGLDGHSNGAEQIAVRARDAGFEVVYSGIRLTPAQIIAAAVEEDVDVVGLSILSGSHLSIVPDVVNGLRDAGLDDVPVVLGGIIPEADVATMKDAGVARVFTPKDFAITDVLGEIVDAIEDARS
jgi:(2R)-ethylmalonyl-CoA mutase